jgi:alpha-glucuronidase
MAWLRLSSSFFFFRYRDYARFLASTGINAIVWDNVNACGADNQKILSRDVIA